MAHLDDDVAAYVDGQLTPRATESATRHLRRCEHCRHAVETQQQLKSRMRGSAAAGPPPDLASTLRQLALDPAHQPADAHGTHSDPVLTVRRRWWRSGAVGVGAVVVGACAAVGVTAYAAGDELPGAADAVRPTFDAYATDFAQGTPIADGSMTEARMDSLDRDGWPCHAQLGTTLQRVDGRWREGGDTVSIRYTDGVRRLLLVEQTGRLDDSSLGSFDERELDGHPVWVRGESPRTVTWDADGVIYTVVTDVADAELEDAIRLLPRSPRSRDVPQRLEHGITTMTSWMSPA